MPGGVGDHLSDWMWAYIPTSRPWLRGLPTLLAFAGCPGLGRPLVDTIGGSELPNLKELRPVRLAGPRCGCCSSSTPCTARCSWLAGTLAGQWSDLYKTAIPEAEQAYAVHRQSRRSERASTEQPNARYWDDLVEDFGFTREERRPSVREQAA